MFRSLWRWEQLSFEWQCYQAHIRMMQKPQITQRYLYPIHHRVVIPRVIFSHTQNEYWPRRRLAQVRWSENGGKRPDWSELNASRPSPPSLGLWLDYLLVTQRSEDLSWGRNGLRRCMQFWLRSNILQNELCWFSSTLLLWRGPWIFR